MPSHQTLVTTLRYEDANDAIRWLANAFGLTEQFVVRNDDGQVEPAQLCWRGSLVMLGDAKCGVHDLPHRHGSLSLTAESAAQVDEPFERCRADGAQVVQPVADIAYTCATATAVSQARACRPADHAGYTFSSSPIQIASRSRVSRPAPAGRHRRRGSRQHRAALLNESSVQFAHPLHALAEPLA